MEAIWPGDQLKQQMLRDATWPGNFADCACHVKALLARIEELESNSDVAKLLRLINDLRDDEPCEYDHHGYCQAHSLHEKPCPHEEAAKLFVAR